MQLVRMHVKLDDGPKVLADLLVIEGTATPLLGRETAELMGVLRIGVNHVTGSEAYGDNLVQRFPKLWKGIGCLKSVKVKHIDNSVLPVAQKHSTVPFHLQEKVAKEIAKLCLVQLSGSHGS